MTGLDVSNAEAALLGLLSEGARHPYQIEKTVEERSMRYWTDLSMSSIYKLLRKLEKEELVSAKATISEDNRTRKIYQLTDTGRDALHEKLKLLLSKPADLKWPLHIALSNLNLLSAEEAVGCLVQYRDKVKEQIKGYHELRDYLEEDGCPLHRQHMALQPLALFEGELRWVEEYIEALSETRTIE